MPVGALPAVAVVGSGTVVCVGITPSGRMLATGTAVGFTLAGDMDTVLRPVPAAAPG